MGFCEFRYPDEVTPTASFTPDNSPVTPGSGIGFLSGIDAEVMADGVTMSRYRIAASTQEFELQFRILSDTELGSLLTFLAATNAETFRMKAPITLGTFYTVAFVPGQDGYGKLDLQSVSPGLWSVKMALRTVAGTGS